MQEAVEQERGPDLDRLPTLSEDFFSKQIHTSELTGPTPSLSTQSSRYNAPLRSLRLFVRRK